MCVLRLWEKQISLWPTACLVRRIAHLKSTETRAPGPNKKEWKKLRMLGGSTLVHRPPNLSARWDVGCKF